METGSVYQEFNIAKILRYAPKGLKLYSPLFGEVDLSEIENGIIRVENEVSAGLFNHDGRYYDYPNAECLLYPSINHRCWNNWQNTLFLESIGSVCVDTITGNKFILGEDGTYFSDNTGNSYHFLIDDEDSGNYLLNSRYATPEETKEFFEELEKNGYKWNGKMVVKKEQNKPKFKIGDIIKHKSTGEISTIKKVCSNFYILEKGTTLYFESQDMWELVASRVNHSLENKIPTAQEIYYAANNMKSFEDKVSVLADEILALKEKLLALEKLAKDSEIKIDALECGGKPFQCPDKAGDNITLEDMRNE